MFYKELKETFRQTIFVMMFLILVPLLYLLDSSVYRTGFTFMEYMSNGFDIFILILACSLAYNMFRMEEIDGATEYILSLPMSRMTLLRYKILPRVAILFAMLLIGSNLNTIRCSQGSVLGMIFLNWNAGIFYLVGLMGFIQISGFILGLINRASWSARLLLAVMVVCAWQFGTVSTVINRLVYKIFDVWTAVRVSCWFGSNGIAILDFTVFYSLIWFILKPLLSIWDLKSTRVREVWFQKRALLPLLVFLLLFLNRFQVNGYIPFMTYWAF